MIELPIAVLIALCVLSLPTVALVVIIGVALIADIIAAAGYKPKK